LVDLRFNSRKGTIWLLPKVIIPVGSHRPAIVSNGCSEITPGLPANPTAIQNVAGGKRQIKCWASCRNPEVVRSRHHRISTEKSASRRSPGSPFLNRLPRNGTHCRLGRDGFDPFQCTTSLSRTISNSAKRAPEGAINPEITEPHKVAAGVVVPHAVGITAAGAIAAGVIAVGGLNCSIDFNPSCVIDALQK